MYVILKLFLATVSTVLFFLLNSSFFVFNFSVNLLISALSFSIFALKALASMFFLPLTILGVSENTKPVRDDKIISIFSLSLYFPITKPVKVSFVSYLHIKLIL